MTPPKRRRRAERTVPIPEITGLVDPRLYGALCAGRAPMFDDEVDDETHTERAERLTRARALCRHCPVRHACRTASTEHAATGIWAGELMDRHVSDRSATIAPDAPNGDAA